MQTQTGTFKTFDEEELFYRQWKHEAPLNGRILIMLHRGHEHSERLESIAKEKAFEGYSIYSYDNRGHGYTKVDAAYEFMDLVRDLDVFVKFVCEQEGKEENDVFLIANSVAGVVASTWVHDYAPNIKGMALIAPAFKIKLYFPFAKEFLKLAIAVKPKLNIKSYVKSKFLTHDVKEQERYNKDKLITPNIPARQLTTLLDTAKRVVDDAEHIMVPTLLLSATKDYVVDSKIQGDFYAKLSSNFKKFVPLKNFYHGVLYESQYMEAIEEISSFLEQSFTKNAENMLKKSISYSQREKDQISYGSLSINRKIGYEIQRFSMSKMGTLSDGIKVGLKYGFDSGVTLDHVYKNQPSGKTFIGKEIDRNYLNSVGWKGIRQRKVNMIMSIKKQIKLLQNRNNKVTILDIAGGPARYLIEIAEEFPSVQIEVRDYQVQNIEEGRELAKNRGLNNITYTQADAFNVNNYKREEITPNIVIISGIFELFEENLLIENAIKGVVSIMDDDSTLLYTGQPWHPQLEQIAHVLKNHQNEPWIMRRRSQYELDHLFGEYGFKKESMFIDNWGIFTVSTAKLHKTI